MLLIKQSECRLAQPNCCHCFKMGYIHCPGRPQTWCVAKGDLALFILLFLLSHAGIRGGHRCSHPHVVLVTEPRSSVH